MGSNPTANAVSGLGKAGAINPFAAAIAGSAAPNAAPGPSLGGINPFAALIAGGGGGVAAPQNPVQVAQNGINRYAGLIAGSGNPQAVQQAQNVATHNAGGGWFNDVLKAIDIPRSIVVSGLDTTLQNGPGALAGGIGGILGLLGNSQARQNFAQGVENHVTFGHVLNQDLGVHNHVADTVGGFVGDVAADPLTYVGGLGDAAKAAGVAGHVAEAVSAGSKAAQAADEAAKASDLLKAAEAAGTKGEDLAGLQATHDAAQQAAKQAAADAETLTGGKFAGGQLKDAVITPDTQVRLQTRGIAGLTPEERSFLSDRLGTKIETGLGIRLPGSKLAGNPKMLTLIPGSLTDPVTSTLHGLVSRLADTRVANGLEEKLVNLGAVKSAIRSAALAGDGERAAKLTNVLRALPEASGAARQTLNQFGPQFAEALSNLPAAAMEHVPAAMEGDAAAAQAIADAGGDVGPLREAYSALRSYAAQMGVPIGSIENYFPHQLTAAAKEALTTAGSTGRARKAFEGALQRQYKAGSSFLGQQLQTGSIEEMNQIAHDVYGKDAFDLFKSDPREVTAQYVRGLARRIGEQHFANRLDELGITTSGDMAMAPEEWRGLMQSYAKTLGKQASKATVKSEKVGAKADRIGQVVDQAARGFAPPERGPLAKALAQIEQSAADRNGGPVGSWVGKGRKGPVAAVAAPLSADQIVEHGSRLGRVLSDIATSHGEAAQRLGEAADAATRASGQASPEMVPLAATGAHANQMAEPYVKDALAKIAEAQAHGKPSKGLLAWYDKSLRLWKSYQLAMPGKAIRHTLAGPAWGTYLGNVGYSSLRDGFSAWRAFQKALKTSGGDVEKALGALSPDTASEVRAALQQGIFHGHEFDMSKISGRGGANWNPLSPRFQYFDKNTEAQARGQDYWRFAMYHDAVKKGMLPAEAARKVRTMLGDPHAITSFERSTARRAIPFYTFLRQNLPVELAALATQPGKFVNSYDAAKNETEQWSNPEAIVPQYFDQTLSMRLPIEIGGNRVYLSPDLPFTRIGQLFGGANQVAAQTSPLIQDVIAAVDHVNTFTGQPFSPKAKAAPGAWTAIPGLMEALHAIAPGSVMKTDKAATDYGVTTPAGTWEVTPQAESIIESLLPPLAQARRVDTTEPNMKPRGDTTILSDLVGQNFRTNDPYQQAGDLYRRQAALKAIIENLQNRSQLPRFIYGFRP